MTTRTPDETLETAAALGDYNALWVAAFPLIAAAVRDLQAAGTIGRDLDPNELCQEAAVRVGEAVRRWDPERGAFSTFVTATARGAVLNYVNREANGGTGSHNASVAVCALEPDTPDLPSLEDCTGDLDRVHLPGAFARLPERERAVLARRYGLDGHAPQSAAALAKDWGVAPLTVKRVTARALARLRRRLA